MISFISVKEFEVQKFEQLLPDKHSPVCFTSDSFMDENTKSAVHYSRRVENPRTSPDSSGDDPGLL